MSASPKTSFRFAAVASATGIFVSRIGGLIREIFLAFYFGAGPVFDAFVVAFRIPNSFRQFVAEGAFTVACLPHYSDARKQGIEAEGAFLAAVVLRWSLVLAVGSVVLGLFMPWIVPVFAPGFGPDSNQLELAISLGRILSGYLWLVGLYGFTMAIAQGRKKFFWVSMAPLGMNLGMIAAVAIASTEGLVLEQGVHLLAWGVLVGGALQLGLSVIPLKRGIRPLWRQHKQAAGSFFAVLRTALPASLGLAVWQLQIIIVTAMATIAGTGSVSVLFFADRLLQLPLALIGTATGSVSLAYLADQSSDHERYQNLLDDALSWVWLLTAPAAVLLWVYTGPLVSLIYYHGAFSETDALAVSSVLRILAFGLPGAVTARVLTSGFHARKDTRTPALIAACVVAVVGISSWLTVHKWGVTGLAAALVAGSWSQALLAGILLRFKGVMWGQTVFPKLPGLLLAGAITGVITSLLPSLGYAALDLVVGGVVGGGVYCVVLWYAGGTYWRGILRDILLKWTRRKQG